MMSGVPPIESPHRRFRLVVVAVSLVARGPRVGGEPAWLASGGRPLPQGSQLVPEVARSLPTLSPDGRTYTFTIRPGFRFSPPSNESVTAATFKYSIERSVDSRMNGTAPAYLGDIVGVKAFRAGKTRHIAGIRARGDTLTIRLTGVSGSFLSRIAVAPGLVLSNRPPQLDQRLAPGIVDRVQPWPTTTCAKWMTDCARPTGTIACAAR